MSSSSSSSGSGSGSGTSVDAVQENMKDLVRTLFEVLLKVHQTQDVTSLGPASHTVAEIASRCKAVHSSIDSLVGIDKAQQQQEDEINALQRLLHQKHQHILQLDEQLKGLRDDLEQRITVELSDELLGLSASI